MDRSSRGCCSRGCWGGEGWVVYLATFVHACGSTVSVWLEGGSLECHLVKEA